jgi:rhodanese-related sulfurtransferase
MSAIAQALVILLLAGAAAAATYHWHPQRPALYVVQEPLRDDEVTVAQVQERWQGKVLWIDARPREQYDQEHIPGATLLNEQQFDELLVASLDTLQTNTKPVIIYCSGQRCEASRKVREKLLELVAINDCYVLKGGFPAWKEAQKNQEIPRAEAFLDKR